MSRSYSHVGLKEEAQLFLEQNIVMKPECCPHCGSVLRESLGKVQYTEEDVFVGEMIPLYEYALKNGCVAKEIFQDIPWSSGPVGFQCLLIDGERKFEWTEEEMQEYL